MEFLKEVFSELRHMLSEGPNGALLAMFGAAAQYIYRIRLNKTSFNFIQFVLTLFLGVWLGTLVGQFLPEDMPYRDGWLSLSGFAMFQVYAAIEGTLEKVLKEKGLFGLLNQKK